MPAAYSPIPSSSHAAPSSEGFLSLRLVLLVQIKKAETRGTMNPWL